MRRLMITMAAAAAIATPASAALAPGAAAPMFETMGAIAGHPVKVRLAKLLKKGPVVLYFFPAAYTSGCNAEAKAFADNLDQFTAAGATVIGMSADPLDQLERFSQSHCAGKFAVATATPAVIRGYDVALGRQVNGRDATNRTSFVIGQDGRIRFALTDMAPGAHIRETLAAVQAMHRPKG